MKIITITLNPAFDIHCYTRNFRPFQENLARITERAAGGKGVNISRALTANGIENTALVVLGDENAEEFRRSLSAYGMNVREIIVGGRIRENMTLHTDDSPETRISFSGFDADDSLLSSVADMLKEADGDTVVTFTGRVPEGLSLDAVKNMLIGLRDKGVKIVIDSKSFGIQDLIECRPWLIKPNDEEIVDYCDTTIDGLETAVAEAEKLRGLGIENVMISLGSKGAVLACDDGRFIVDAPRIDVRSTIGAGDSSIGGFIAALSKGLPFADMLRWAVSFGSAACMTEGTEPPERSDVERLLSEITVRHV